MKNFEEKKFEIPELKGISAKTIEEHLKLYSGYVKHANLILDQMGKLMKAGELSPADAYSLSELQRRFAFEFCGMRIHEYYFGSFKGGPVGVDESGPVYGGIAEEFGAFETWLAQFKLLAATRGIGWAVLYYDPHTNRFLNQWIDEHHLNHLASSCIILALDVWEHAYVADYLPSGKKQYVDDFFSNLNWEMIDRNFTDIKRLPSF